MDFFIFLPFLVLVPVFGVFLIAFLFNLLLADRKWTRRLLWPTVLVGLMLAGWSLFTYQEIALNESLAAAAWNGDRAEVASLLERGASPEGTFDDRSALSLAREAGHREIVEMLIRAGARE